MNISCATRFCSCLLLFLVGFLCDWGKKMWKWSKHTVNSVKKCSPSWNVSSIFHIQMWLISSFDECFEFGLCRMQFSQQRCKHILFQSQCFQTIDTKNHKLRSFRCWSCQSLFRFFVRRSVFSPQWQMRIKQIANNWKRFFPLQTVGRYSVFILKTMSKTEPV